MPKEEIIHSITSFLFFILVLAGLALIAFFVFRPGDLLQKSRDAHRNSDLAEIANTINLYLADNKNFNSLVTGQVYDSLSGNNQIDSTGWIPLNIQSISSGTPIGKLPIDPTNNISYYYRFGVDVAHGTYEIDCVFEDGSNQEKQVNDQGDNPKRYEIGTDLTIMK